MEQDSAAQLASSVGERVRDLRAARRQTLDQLSRAAGVSRRQLVTIEQGQANPSLSTLLRISYALGVGLPDLVAEPDRAPLRVRRAGAGLPLWRSAAGGQAVLLADFGPPDVLELWEWTLAPGDQQVSEAHRRGCRELLQVLSGAISLQVGSELVELSRGDAAAFRADVPHSYANPGGLPARFTLTVSEAGSPGSKGVDGARA